MAIEKEKVIYTVEKKTLLTLPDSKILALTKLEAFADDKFSITYITISVSDREENIVGKGENAEKMLVTSIFSFFHSVFKRPIPQGHENVGLVGKRIKKRS